MANVLLNGTAYPEIRLSDVYEIQIIGDGNCLFRCLSLFNDKTQENYCYYREIIYNYIQLNKNKLQIFFHKEENESEEQYLARYEEFILSIQKDQTYAGDFEISSACILLNTKILIYTFSLSGYKLLNEYTPTKTNKAGIYIVYRNNNHFNLLSQKNNSNDEIRDINKYEITKIHKNLEKNIHNLNINKVETKNFRKIFDKKYVDYKRVECPNLYNEIYDYFTKKELPLRLISPFMEKVNEYYMKKTNEEDIEAKDNPFIIKSNNEEDNKKRQKRKNFRALINNKYIIKENRLYYKYERIKGQIIEKKIPYKIELPFIFYTCHVNKIIHNSFKRSKENLKNSDYYYEGITKHLMDYILDCPKCKIKKTGQKVTAPMKLLIEEGPHYRLEMDLWYLSEDIAEATGYNFILDIIDVFSKWLFSFPLIHRNSQEILIALRKYLLSFGICKKLQTDNAFEFRSAIINNFCIENNIQRIFSPPYHPRANGAVEAAHKIVEKYVNDYFYTIPKEEFSLETAILDALEYHNTTPHSSTKYSPFELKDTTDKKLIDQVIENIKKTVGKKIKKNNEYLLDHGDKLLLNNNIEIISKNKLIKRKNNKKGTFSIPAIFQNYTKNNLLNVKVSKNYSNILKENEFYLIKNELVRLVDEDGYNYYLEIE